MQLEKNLYLSIWCEPVYGAKKSERGGGLLLLIQWDSAPFITSSNQLQPVWVLYFFLVVYENCLLLTVQGIAFPNLALDVWSEKQNCLKTKLCPKLHIYKP